MRINTGRSGGGAGNFSGTSGSVTGALILSGNPVNPMEAAPKQYVDAAVSNISASSLASGTIPVSRMPAFSGELVSTAGSNSLVLSPSGVAAGIYPKVTVDVKGRVTSGDVLLGSEIPSLDWSKIGSGKPTTLSGYGISDGVSVSGSTMTGFLTLSGAPTAAQHAATKGYVDSALSASTGLSVGDVIRKPYSTTPSGFLKCNGAYVSQASYSGLFGAIGNNFDRTIWNSVNYDNNSSIGSGKPWNRQYDTNTVKNSFVGNWAAGSSLPTTFYGQEPIVTKNRVYLVAGVINSAVSAAVYTAPINVDGSIGTWSSAAPLPTAFSFTQAIVTKNRVYLLGGYNGPYMSNVYTAIINADGTLGAWFSAANMPGGIGDGVAFITKNRVYILGSGGLNSSVVYNTVYTAPINADGTLGGWTSGLPLPITLGGAKVIVTKNMVYLLGGYNGSDFSTTVYIAPINNDGTLGGWVVSSLVLPNSIKNFKNTVITNTKVYIFGGSDGSIWKSSVFVLTINNDGTLGSLEELFTLPLDYKPGTVILTKDKVHLFGGSVGTTQTNITYTASLAGGGNDYLQYYDGSINLFNGNSPITTNNPAPTTQFGLPDLSVSDSNYPGAYSYIKV